MLEASALYRETQTLGGLAYMRGDLSLNSIENVRRLP